MRSVSGAPRSALLSAEFDIRSVVDVATYGAVTGTLGVLSGGTGAFFAVRREIRASRLRLHLGQLSYYSVSRRDPAGLVNAGWAGVYLRNAGGRPLAVEHVGLEFALPVVEGDELKALELVRGEIFLEEPIEPAPDGPIRRVYTPIGPLLALGFDPTSPMTRAWAKTADDREWRGPAEPWLQYVPPGSTVELVGKGLKQLTDDAEPAAKADGLVWLERVRPVLPDDPLAPGPSNSERQDSTDE
jgi:hypothetical protein